MSFHGSQLVDQDGISKRELKVINLTNIFPNPLLRYFSNLKERIESLGWLIWCRCPLASPESQRENWKWPWIPCFWVAACLNLKERIERELRRETAPNLRNLKESQRENWKWLLLGIPPVKAISGISKRELKAPSMNWSSLKLGLPRNLKERIERPAYSTRQAQSTPSWISKRELKDLNPRNNPCKTSFSKPWISKRELKE